MANQTNGTAVTCINDSEVYLAPLLRWLIPVLVLAGVLGNAMILVVLNSSQSMKTKPHLLLSAMAAADLAHTVLALGINMYVYEDLIGSDSFSRIYHHLLKIPLVMLGNWMAMTSTWLAVAVTVERLIAIRYPLKARFVMRNRFIIAAIIVIALVSFVISSYYLFWLRPIVYVSCQQPRRKLYRLYSDQRLWYYGHVSRNLHSVLCSLVPVVLLFTFNASLVYHLHRNQAFMRKFQDQETRSPQSQLEMTDWTSANNNGLDAGQQHSAAGAMIRREYKVAVVVLVISLTSACCLLPSAAIVVFDAARLLLNDNNTPWWYFQATDISNLLVLAEKVLDFFLYCLTSGYFRHRLILVITARRRSSLSTLKHKTRERPKLKRIKFFKSREVGSNETNDRPNIGYMIQDRRASTSTLSSLSTFLGSAACRLRRSTASSDGSQKSPRLQSSSNRRFLTVQSIDGTANGHNHCL